MRLRVRATILEEIDFSAARVQFRNAATQHYIVLRPAPQGGGTLEGSREPEPTPWYFYCAKGASFGNVEVKRAPVEGFNWSNYDSPSDSKSFVAWNHAKRAPNAAAPDAPHDWTIEEAGNGLFRIRFRNGEYLELVPQADASLPPQIITRAKDASNVRQSWEIWLERIAGKQPPRKDLKVDPAATGWTSKIDNAGYVVLLAGKDKPAALTDDLARTRVEELDSGVQDVVDVVGFPAFPPWAEGHFLNWVLLNSGIPGATLLDDKGQPRNGGHQGNRWGHMTFESTPHNPITWTDYESFGALHECIHALQSEQQKFNNPGSGWLHESHNNYLGTLRQKMVFGRYVTEGGNGTVPIVNLQIPHIPIESMGPLKDGTAGGPADQGASNTNTYVAPYGGYRYGNEAFFLSLYLDKGADFVRDLWKNAPKGNDKSLFHILASGGTASAVEEAIMSYGARTALLDFGGWTPLVRRRLRENWQPSNNWFYLFPVASGTSYAPPDGQVPFNQGRNIIPLAVKEGAKRVEVVFTPAEKGTEGTKAELRAQLVARTTKDQPVRSQRVAKDTVTLDIPDGARGGLVFLVVGVVNGPNAASEPNYGFKRTERFKYTFEIRSGATVASTSTRPW